MAVLFTVRNKYFPDDIKPNIIIPYAQKGPIIDSVKLILAIQGLRPRMVKMNDEFSYYFLLKELWEKGEPFIIVEHDIIPFPGAVQELWTNPEPWCGYPYYLSGELKSYLGCTKFDPKLLGEFPLPEEPIAWLYLDRKIESELIRRGYKNYVYPTGVSHLHFGHVRQTDLFLEHPDFWVE